jgi:hypothetical protein
LKNNARKWIGEQYGEQYYEEPTGGYDGPASLLLHDALNQRTVIVANCDLLRTEVKAGPESAKRLGLIHEAVFKMATGLEPYQCRVLEVIRIAAGQKRYAA